jgi:hypothetical protein
MPLSDRQQVASALGAAAHPLRLDILDAFACRLVQGPAEAALLLGATLGNVRHHVRDLHRAGLLTAVGGQRTASGLEGKYEATARAGDLVNALSELG